MFDTKEMSSRFLNEHHIAKNRTLQDQYVNPHPNHFIELGSPTFAFNYAVCLGKYDLASSIISKHEVDLSQKFDYKLQGCKAIEVTPIQMTVLQRNSDPSENIKALEFLLDNGADPRNEAPFFTYVMNHTEIDKKAAVDLLLTAGANINQPDREFEGITPLMIAAHNNDFEMTSYLLEKGADPMRVNDRNQTALTGAIVGFEDEDNLDRDIRVVEALLKAAPEAMEIEDHLGNTPGFYASNVEVMIKMMEADEKKLEQVFEAAPVPKRSMSMRL